jgi:hypothetical protein
LLWASIQLFLFNTHTDARQHKFLQSGDAAIPFQAISRSILQASLDKSRTSGQRDSCTVHGQTGGRQAGEFAASSVACALTYSVCRLRRQRTALDPFIYKESP